MSAHKVHPSHPHTHGPGCGHLKIGHRDHEDYLHDGHLHHPHSDHVDEHSIEIGGANPTDCTPSHACGAHAADHEHGSDCEHQPIPHGDHVDYLVEGHLHHPCQAHCDDHGPVSVAS